MLGIHFQRTQFASQQPFSGPGFSSDNTQDAIIEVKNQIPEVIPFSSLVEYYSNTGSQNTTSVAYSNLTGMSSSPAEGNYLVIFNARSSTSGSNAGGFFAIAVDGITQLDSIRELSCNLVLLGGLVTISINTVSSSITCISKVSITGSQTITAQFKSSNGGTINCFEKNMTIIKV